MTSMDYSVACGTKVANFIVYGKVWAGSGLVGLLGFGFIPEAAVGCRVGETGFYTVFLYDFCKVLLIVFVQERPPSSYPCYKGLIYF